MAMKFVYDEFGNKNRLKKKKSVNSTDLNFKTIEMCHHLDKWIPKTVYAKELLLKNILKNGKFSRTMCVTGHLHHGKSTLVNILASSVHLINEKFLIDSFSDQFFLEKEKGFTLYPNIITLMMHSKKNSSRIFNFIDCPGHPDFQDQVINSMEISDGVILVLDLAEGVMIGTELPLKNAIIRGLPLILILNSIDRLVIEFNLSPSETHLRILNIIDELNIIIQKILGIRGVKNKKQFKYFNPLLNNVCFSSLIQGWTFTVEQFSEVYLSSQPSCCLSSKDLVNLLWNCLSFLKTSGPVSKRFRVNKSFLFQDLILYPLFKLIFFSLTENYLHIRKLIEIELGIYGIGFKDFPKSTERLLNLCLTLFLGGCRDIKLIYNHSGFVNSLSYHIPSGGSFSGMKFINNKILNEIQEIGCIVNFSHQKNPGKTLAVCKVLNGKVRIGDKVRVLTTESFFYYHQRYFSICQIKKMAISVSKYTISISTISTGILAFIKGFEFKLKKNGIFFDLLNFKLGFDFFCLSPGRSLINCQVENLVKIMIKPVLIIDLNVLLKALRICSKVYPNLNCQIKSNENIILSSTSKFYMDCILQDLKEISGKINFQISDTYFPMKESISDIKDLQTNLIDTNLILTTKRSAFLSKNTFPMLGFIGIYKKLCLLFPKKFLLLNSVSGGYISGNLEEKKGLSKTKSNSIWFFHFDKIDPLNCVLIGNYDLGFIKKKKQSLSSEFKVLFKQDSVLSESLCMIEFNLKRKENLSNKFEPELFEKKFEKIQKKLLEATFIRQEPFFLGEIIFPDNYFSIILRFLKKKFAHITSYDNYFGGGIILIRIQISGIRMLKFDQEISLITQGQGYSFFLFDSWRDSY